MVCGSPLRTQIIGDGDISWEYYLKLKKGFINQNKTSDSKRLQGSKVVNNS